MTLQLALILVGALVLAAVTGISLWQQRNNQRPLVRLIQVWILQRIENFNLEDVKKLAQTPAPCRTARPTRTFPHAFR
jgi:hypothetical protein